MAKLNPYVICCGLPPQQAIDSITLMSKCDFHAPAVITVTYTPMTDKRSINVSLFFLCFLWFGCILCAQTAQNAQILLHTIFNPRTPILMKNMDRWKHVSIIHSIYKYNIAHFCECATFYSLIYDEDYMVHMRITYINQQCSKYSLDLSGNEVETKI